MKLDYKKMVEDIDKLLDPDWAFDVIDGHKLPNAKPLTKIQVIEMSEILGRIYAIAHCVHCESCQEKYLVKPQRDT